MQWEFAPEEVVKGGVVYGIPEFRTDLLQEVMANTQGWLDAQAAHACFDAIYDYTYWLATGRRHEDFTLMPESPINLDFLVSIKEPLEPNVIMLGAILQRLIMDGVEEGLPLDEAVLAAARRHESAVSSPIIVNGSGICE